MSRKASIKALDRPIEVVFLTDDLGGGTGNHLLSMLRHWDKRAWDPRIISRAPLTARFAPGISVDYIPPPGRLGFYPVGQIRSLFRVGESLEDRPAGILHTFFFWPILFGRLLKLSGKICCLVENREDEGFNWGRHEYLMLRATRSLPDHVICVSEAVKKVVLERERLDEGRVTVIKNGVVPLATEEGGEQDARRELGLDPDHLIVGMVANFNRTIKGVTNLLDAAPSVLAKVPATRFVFLGKGDETILREKAQALGIEQFVVFPGYREDIDRFYKIMDVSVLTSLSEGLSLTLLESMSHGLPVVATNVGGNPEIITDGENGYLVPLGDGQSLADRIVRLLRDADLRRRMGCEGRANIASRFRMQDVADRYLEVYRGVISR